MLDATNKGGEGVRESIVSAYEDERGGKKRGGRRARLGWKHLLQVVKNLRMAAGKPTPEVIVCSGPPPKTLEEFDERLRYWLKQEPKTEKGMLLQQQRLNVLKMQVCVCVYVCVRQPL